MGKTMAKSQLRKKIDALIGDYTKRLEDELENILEDADMWYGYTGSNGEGKERFSKRDRNADQLVHDGPIGDASVDLWLHTGKELGFS